ncbi:MAG: DNA-processing protein DprA [Pleomorphochaeta sp.]
MNRDNLIQAINWETILNIYNKDYDKACEVWNKYRHMFLFEISSEFTLWASKLKVSINDLYREYNKVKDSFNDFDKEVKILIYGDPDWPNQINDLPYPTKVLYCKGNVSLLKKKNVSIIGSKAPKRENVEKLDKIISNLIKEEILVTSGLSLGTQGHAAVKSLSNFSPVIAVLATPLNVYYPKGHKQIQDYIAKEGGVVVTRVAPGDTNLKWNILLRNRLMCELSTAIFVLEEVDGGGAIQLADYALSRERKVLFLSALKKNESITWPKKLIEHGAKTIRYPSELPKVINNNILKKVENNIKREEVKQLTLF